MIGLLWNHLSLYAQGEGLQDLSFDCSSFCLVLGFEFQGLGLEGSIDFGGEGLGPVSFSGFAGRARALQVRGFHWAMEGGGIGCIQIRGLGSWGLGLLLQKEGSLISDACSPATLNSPPPLYEILKEILLA